MILTQIEAHLRRTGIKPTAFGRAVANDPRLVFDLRHGREPGPRMVARISAYLEATR
jgi:hypothetical protein